MNLTILSSLTKSPEMPKAVPGGEQPASGQNAFEHIFEQSNFKATDDGPHDMPPPDAENSLAEDVDTAVEDPNAPDATASTLFASDPMRISARNVLPDHASRSADPKAIHDGSRTPTFGDGSVTPVTTAKVITPHEANAVLPVPKVAESIASGQSQKAVVMPHDTAPSKHPQPGDATIKPSNSLPVVSATHKPIVQRHGDFIPSADGPAAAKSAVTVTPILRETAHQTTPRYLAQPAESKSVVGSDDHHAAAAGDAPTKRDQVLAMSTLDRHLLGRPATLMSTGVGAPPRSASMRELSDVKGSTPRGTDAMLANFGPVNANQITVSIPGFSNAANSLGLRMTFFDAQKNTVDSELFPNAVGDEIGWDVRASSPVQGTVHAATLPRSDLAASVVHQIAEAARLSGDKPIEIALNPVELGRVRMILTATDAGITVSILADRPDTLDLLRRNIDDLGKSFADLGYDDISFSFGQGGQMADNSERQHNDTPPILHDDIPIAEPAIPLQRSSTDLTIASDGIDLRL